MTKRTHQCPYCKDWFRDVDGHISRMHKEKSAAMASNHGNTPKPKAKGRTLELKTPPQKETPEPQGYHCIDCGAVVTKGQNPCPNCGAQLDWSSL
ncbi:hypothetical protein ES703_104950 [subsurface metagenome]